MFNYRQEKIQNHISRVRYFLPVAEVILLFDAERGKDDIMPLSLHLAANEMSRCGHLMRFPYAVMTVTCPCRTPLAYAHLHNTYTPDLEILYLGQNFIKRCTSHSLSRLAVAVFRLDYLRFVVVKDPVRVVVN